MHLQSSFAIRTSVIQNVYNLGCICWGVGREVQPHAREMVCTCPIKSRKQLVGAIIRVTAGRILPCFVTITDYFFVRELRWPLTTVTPTEI